MKPSLRIFTLLTASSLCWAATCDGGVLNGHPLAYNNGLGPASGAWTGATPYQDKSIGGTQLFGTLEWAVFKPADFPFAGLSGWSPTAGQLVYAYQVHLALMVPCFRTRLQTLEPSTWEVREISHLRWFMVTSLAWASHSWNRRFPLREALAPDWCTAATKRRRWELRSLARLTCSWT
jgi:hypothetical protein